MYRKAGGGGGGGGAEAGASASSSDARSAPAACTALRTSARSADSSEAEPEMDHAGGHSVSGKVSAQWAEAGDGDVASSPSRRRSSGCWAGPRALLCFSRSMCAMIHSDTARFSATKAAPRTRKDSGGAEEEKQRRTVADHSGGSAAAQPGQPGGSTARRSLRVNDDACACDCDCACGGKDVRTGVVDRGSGADVAEECADADGPSIGRAPTVAAGEGRREGRGGEARGGEGRGEEGRQDHRSRAPPLIARSLLLAVAITGPVQAPDPAISGRCHCGSQAAGAAQREGAPVTVSGALPALWSRQTPIHQPIAAAAAAADG